jgi:hypothetical protein
VVQSEVGVFLGFEQNSFEVLRELRVFDEFVFCCEQVAVQSSVFFDCLYCFSGAVEEKVLF